MIIRILKQPQKPAYSLNSCHIYSPLNILWYHRVLLQQCQRWRECCIGWLSMASPEMCDKTSCDLSALNFPLLCDTEGLTVADLTKQLWRQGLNALLSGNSNLVRCFSQAGWSWGMTNIPSSRCFANGYLLAFCSGFF